MNGMIGKRSTMIADEHTAQPTERVERHFDVATLTLIETALEDVGLTGTQSRRQVVVRGVRLNELADRRGMGATLHLSQRRNRSKLDSGMSYLGAPLGPRNVPQNGQAGIPTRADKTRCQRREYHSIATP